jgi:hypothetical protein
LFGRVHSTTDTLSIIGPLRQRQVMSFPMLLADSKGTTPKDHTKLLSIRQKIVTKGCEETVLILSAQESRFPLVWIPWSIREFRAECFEGCKAIQSFSFELCSGLIRIESSAFSFSSLKSIEIPRNVEIVGSSCFYKCGSLSSISFESNSRLTRIESSTFSYSSLKSIEIPRNVENLGSSCFSNCQSLSSISFESNSRFTRNEAEG